MKFWLACVAFFRGLRSADLRVVVFYFLVFFLCFLFFLLFWSFVFLSVDDFVFILGHLRILPVS